MCIYKIFALHTIWCVFRASRLPERRRRRRFRNGGKKRRGNSGTFSFERILFAIKKRGKREKEKSTRHWDTWHAITRVAFTKRSYIIVGLMRFARDARGENVIVGRNEGPLWKLWAVTVDLIIIVSSAQYPPRFNPTSTLYLPLCSRSPAVFLPFPFLASKCFHRKSLSF